MKKIKILPETIRQKIAAGEVVEDHSSIVRELIDNSYDAKSKNIKLYLEKSGIESLILTDDGEGIYKDDLEVICLNGSTSKIEKEDDLFNIKTLGFRGEALHSISNVSKFILKSKPKDQDIGYKLEIQGQIKLNLSPYPMNNGTQIEIYDLFFNMPARKKFLPERGILLKKIKDIFNKKALSFFESNFFMYNDGKEIFSYTKNDFFGRISEIFGENTYKNLIKLFFSVNNLNYDLNNLINNDSLFSIKKLFEKFNIYNLYVAFSDKSFFSKYSSTISIIINKRTIHFENLEKRIRSLYYNFLPRGFYPYFFIYIEMDPSLLDQNIDPIKSKIKIKDEKDFVDLIERFLYFSLLKDNTNSDITFNNIINIDKEQNVNQIEKNFLKNEKDLKEIDLLENESYIHNVEFENSNYSDSFISEKLESFDKIKPEFKNEIFDKHFGTFIGIIYKTYLVFENRETLFVVDFHAAYEACNFLRLKNEKNSKRSLLFPIKFEVNLSKTNILNFSKNNYNEFNENDENDENKDNIFLYKLEFLRNLGFEIERISINSFVLSSIPTIINESFIESIIEEIKNFLEDEHNQEIIENYININFYENNEKKLSNNNKKNLSTFEKIKDIIISKIACKISPKANENITYIDIFNLLKLMINYNYPQSCPHGRPVFIKLEKDFFDKKFMRKK
jgi:DNA mismatch repair protein MutL